jgi:hypothetical protein
MAPIMPATGGEGGVMARANAKNWLELYQWKW